MGFRNIVFMVAKNIQFFRLPENNFLGRNETDLIGFR